MDENCLIVHHERTISTLAFVQLTLSCDDDNSYKVTGTRMQLIQN